MKIDFHRTVELAVLNPGRAILSEVKKRELTEDSELYGVRAVGVIHIPHKYLGVDGEKLSYKIQEIESGGVWGDGPGVIDDEFPTQRDELFQFLKILNVVIPEEFTKEG